METCAWRATTGGGGSSHDMQSPTWLRTGSASRLCAMAVHHVWRRCTRRRSTTHTKRFVISRPGPPYKAAHVFLVRGPAGRMHRLPRSVDAT